MGVLGPDRGKLFQEGDGSLKDIDEKPFQAQIRELEQGKAQSQQLISENKKTIDIYDREIEKLRDLESRLKRIYWVKNYKDLGSALEVSSFVNKITLRELTEALNFLTGSNFQFSISQSIIANLTIFQALFILFSSELPDLNKNTSLNKPEDDPGPETQEEETKQ
jgi:hypothetical protein